MGGIILAFPYILWELWRFIKPALKNNEKKGTSGFVVVATALFVAGVSFAYFIIVPLTIQFLGSYKVSAEVMNRISLDSYISLVSTLVLATGIVFELPIVVYFLSKMGLITPQFMRKYRKHAFVIILIVAAIITPSPDIASQLLVTFPLYMLYETSVFVSAYVINKKSKTIVK
jgi:sec-independent protein translocase protein TatC